MSESVAMDAKDVEAAVFAKAEDEREPEAIVEDEVETPEPEKPAVAEKTEAEKEAEKNAKAQSAVQKRIDELTRQKNDALREAEYYRRLTEAKKEQAEPKKLNQEDFPTYDDYIAALVEQRAAEVVEKRIEATLNERQEGAQRQARQADEEVKIAAWMERQASFSNTTPDYVEVMKSAENVEIPEHMVLAMLDSERGPQIAYYLAKNPGECKAISALPALSAARAIGRIERQLESEPAKAAPVSEAPAPLKPLRGGTAGGVGKHPDDMTQKEFNAWREKAQKKRFSG